MDIYEYAESINYGADYYDFQTGYTYHIAEYGRMLRFFGITEPGIRISEDGVTIGYARRYEE